MGSVSIIHSTSMTKYMVAKYWAKYLCDTQPLCHVGLGEGPLVFSWVSQGCCGLGCMVILISLLFSSRVCHIEVLLYGFWLV